MNNVRRVIVGVRVLMFETYNFAKIHLKRYANKVEDKFYFLTSDIEGTSGDNEMTFETFRNILSSMHLQELRNLQSNIRGDEQNIIKSMVDDELRKRHRPLKDKKTLPELGLIKASDLEKR